MKQSLVLNKVSDLVGTKSIFGKFKIGSFKFDGNKILRKFLIPALSILLFVGLWHTGSKALFQMEADYKIEKALTDQGREAAEAMQACIASGDVSCQPNTLPSPSQVWQSLQSLIADHKVISADKKAFAEKTAGINAKREAEGKAPITYTGRPSFVDQIFTSLKTVFAGFLLALIIAVPTAIKVYNWVLTLWRGNIHLTIPMLFSLGFIVTFVNGGITGLFLGNVIIDVPLSDTYFVVAHFHMVMGIAPLMVVFGAIYHWYPLITGRHLNQILGKIHFWVTFVGAYAIYFPMHYLGFIGVPRRYFEMYDSPYMTSGVGLNQFITVAALIVGFTQFIFLYNIFTSWYKGEKSERNPWKANSLEWHTPDYPPTHGNFGKELPVVYRWPYDFSVPGSDKEYIPQHIAPSEVPAAKAEQT